MKSAELIDGFFKMKHSGESTTSVSEKSTTVTDEILVVEDDDLTRNLIQRLLEKEFKNDITTLSNGLEGLEYARTNRPKMIILDLMLPGMDGYEVLKELRDNELLEKTKIILISAKSRSDDIERGFELTADEYITKPFQPGEFIVRVRKLLK
jgi:two-component system alkaline phosphatase synthesis response regulator PhoP